MKTIKTNNQALIEVLIDNGVEIVCNDNMQMQIVSGADKIKAIVAEFAPAAADDYTIVEYGYIIDYVDGSGSGCGTIFDTKEEAERHMSFWTEEERKGCEIVPVEVGYLVYVDGWSKGERYIWEPEDIEDSGLCDCPNGYDDLWDTLEEAEDLKDKAEKYIEAHDYDALTVGIEKVIKA